MNVNSSLSTLKQQSLGFWFATLAVIVIAAAVVSLPILRSRELREIETAVFQSSTLLIDALKNPSIFTGDPPEARAALEADAKQLSMLHDRLVLSHYHFANSALESALSYTDYTARVANKLLQVGAAEQDAINSVATYDQGVAQLKQSSLANRVSMQAVVNEMTPKVRESTDLAYQECQLLETLTSQFGIHQTMALQHLTSLGPDVLAAAGSLRPALVAASEKTLIMRNRFNPVLH